MAKIFKWGKINIRYCMQLRTTKFDFGQGAIVSRRIQANEQINSFRRNVRQKTGAKKKQERRYRKYHQQQKRHTQMHAHMTYSHSWRTEIK